MSLRERLRLNKAGAGVDSVAASVQDDLKNVGRGELAGCKNVEALDGDRENRGGRKWMAGCYGTLRLCCPSGQMRMWM